MDSCLKEIFDAKSTAEQELLCQLNFGKNLDKFMEDYQIDVLEKISSYNEKLDVTDIKIHQLMCIDSFEECSEVHIKCLIECGSTRNDKTYKEAMELNDLLQHSTKNMFFHANINYKMNYQDESFFFTKQDGKLHKIESKDDYYSANRYINTYSNYIQSDPSIQIEAFISFVKERLSQQTFDSVLKIIRKYKKISYA